MTYSGELVIPTRYVEVAEDEMMYLDGGISIAVRREMLNKNYCLQISNSLARRTGMTVVRCAKEVYAHARLYYAATLLLCTTLNRKGVLSNVINYIRSHSNPIELGADSAVRVSAYNIIWAVS